MTILSSGTFCETSRIALISFGSGNGKYTEAESLYKRALAADEQSLGLESPDVATALRNLGCLYRDREQFNINKAEPILKRALAIREKALGPEHPDTAASLSDLSLLYFYEKKFAAAEKFAQRALPVQEKVFGPNGLEVSTALNRLGIAERELGNLSGAETTLKRALAIRESKLGPNHPFSMPSTIPPSIAARSSPCSAPSASSPPTPI